MTEPTSTAGLRERLAEAMRAADEHWCQTLDGTDYEALAAAVEPVVAELQADRDRRVAEARRLLAEARQQMEQIEANANHNAELFHDVITDRDQYAAEVARVRAECAAMEGELAASADDGMRAAVTRILAALDRIGEA